MMNFNANQQQEIRKMYAMLKRMAAHPAHPFYVKTFHKILDQYELLEDSSINAEETRPQVFEIQKSYLLNMLSAVNLRIDSILLGRSA